MLHSLKAEMPPSLCFQIRTWNSIGGDRIQDGPIELQMGIQKNHAGLVQGPNQPKLCFQIRTWNSTGGDSIQDVPIEIQMGIHKDHAGLAQGPKVAQVYVFRFELGVAQLVIGCRMTPLIDRWGFERISTKPDKIQDLAGNTSTGQGWCKGGGPWGGPAWQDRGRDLKTLNSLNPLRYLRFEQEAYISD